jgi:peptide/nickel transport system substrate-binding protein
MPYEPVAVWLIDQWRKIGLNVTQKPLELGAYFLDLGAGKHEMYLMSMSGYMDDPDDLLVVTHSSYPQGFMRYKDRIVDELYAKQSVAIDPAERRRLCKQYQLRIFDEMTYMVPFLWWHRMIPVSSNVKGIKLLPNHFINQDRSTIWLSKD